MTATDKIIERYLNFSGDRTFSDFVEFLKVVALEMNRTPQDSPDYVFLKYIQDKLLHGLELCVKYGNIYAVIDEQSKEDIEDILKEKGYLSGSKKITRNKKAPRKTPNKKTGKQSKKQTKNQLGKLVDHGEVPEDGSSDTYWGREKIKIVFEPEDNKVRHGAKLPASYKYTDMHYLEKYYNLRGIEFGNWLSQQDRANYVAALGLALFDFHTAIGFSPKHMGIKEKLTVSFGARGRGMATAHFTPKNFVINLTRYSRPPKVKNRSEKYQRVRLLITDGGLGAYAHEFAHALDYYAGMFIEKSPGGSISGGHSTETAQHKPPFAKGSLRALMESLLAKIIWKNKNTHSDYYKRLKKATKGKYYFYRAELFARAFEMYLHNKLSQKGYFNIFLGEQKYNTSYYLTMAEAKRLERDFDALMSAIKKHL